jgi:glyoxylase-like metal-dependent hydrolase (beta-lactamase superfamily II)
MKPRAFTAPNASAMTLTGTVTYVIGDADVAIIDPGSADAAHIDALSAAVAGASSVRILLTHDHPDHSGGARQLARRVDGRVFSIGTGMLRDGSVIPTDHGDLTTLATPGHTPDHAAFHWPAGKAIFCGDLMMGGLDTALVAAPEGDLGLYLTSLERIRNLAPEIIYPAHGPAFTDPQAALDRYVQHREKREQQVLAAAASGVCGLDGITDVVYGPDLDPELRSYARAAIQAYLKHLLDTDRMPTADD